jgi:hypothetical protein
VLGDAAGQELHAVKRLSLGERATARLAHPARTPAGAAVTALTLHLVPPRPAQPPAAVASRLSWRCPLPSHPLRSAALCASDAAGRERAGRAPKAVCV